MNTSTFVALIIITALRVSSASAAPVANQKTIPPPTIHVEATYSVPGSGNAYSSFRWDTTNADYVLIMGDPQHYPPKGALGGSGSKIFVAVGPGGTASQAIGAYLHEIPIGPTLGGGVRYSFDREFKVEQFFQNSHKVSLDSNKSPLEIAKAAVIILERMHYTADNTKGIDQSPMVYTVDFLPNNNLPDQTPDELKKGLLVKRQIGFVIFAKDHWLHILPLVKKNRPDDNDKWADDPDGLQLAKPALEALATAIIEAVTSRKE
ncbi:MAG TPA: hypothetical protein VGN86_07880 [Pyrinomonadaceae bacterium]|nr:hypothetical protein [Pyrinomonadaceae bacterium]